MAVFRRRSHPESAHVIGLEWRLDPNAPEPVLVAGGTGGALLVVNAHWDEAGARIALRLGPIGAMTMGYPNDEATNATQVLPAGVRWHELNEVQNSAWLERLRRNNRVRFPDHVLFEGYRHLVLPMKDESFQCLCKDFTAELTDSPTSELVQAFLTESE